MKTKWLAFVLCCVAPLIEEARAEGAGLETASGADGSLVLSAGNSELGDSDETVATEYTGESLAISFNADFLVDALKHMDAETVRVGLNTALSPVLIRPLGDDGHTCLLMPVNRV